MSIAIALALAVVIQDLQAVGLGFPSRDTQIIQTFGKYGGNVVSSPTRALKKSGVYQPLEGLLERGGLPPKALCQFRPRNPRTLNHFF